MTRKYPPVKRKQDACRASVTFPPDLYQTLEDLAEKKKVSIAWIVRDAAEQYVVNQWPLLENSEGRERGK